QHLVNGLVLGGTYALLGIGLTLIFGLMSVVNFAHGEFYTLGAYAAFATLALAGLPFFVALLAAIAAGAVLGALTERALLRPLRRGGGAARPGLPRLSVDGRPRVAEGLLGRHPRRARELRGRDARRASARRRRGAGRRVHLVGLSRRGRLRRDHPRAALPPGR